MVTRVSLDDSVSVVARQLLETLGGRARVGLGWEDQLLHWAMRREDLRVPLFRLIDCLPALSASSDIAQHIQAYFQSVELPAPLQRILHVTNPHGLSGQLAAKTLTTAVAALAHKYIAGETLGQLLKTLERHQREGLAVTVDVLGEAVVSEAEAQAYLDRYCQLMQHLSSQFESPSPSLEGIDRFPTRQISVKLTAFDSQLHPLEGASAIDPGTLRICDRLRTLLREAQRWNCAVHFDMEQYAYKSLTLRILKSLLMEPEFRDRDDVGLTIQAYLKDSRSDLEGLIAWVHDRGTPITIRLVKGAYWDQEVIHARQHHWPVPVFEAKAATDANFEALTQMLLTHHEVVYAAIGSHNVRSLSQAIVLAETLEIPSRRFECQMLYGMADSLARAIAQRGHRVRVYCPYGALIPGMAYLTRRLLENTANTSVLRHTMTDTPIAELLAAPQVEPPPVVVPIVAEFQNEPDRNYADPHQRDGAIAAIQQVRTQLGRHYWPWIQGEWTPTPQVQPVVNPSDLTETLGQVGLLEIPQVEKAVQAAQQAFLSWRHVSVAERSRLLHTVADLMHQRRDELAAWMCLEVGKPLAEANGEVSEAIDFCRYYATQMERLDRSGTHHIPGETNHYRYAPRGIVLVISPWNFPLAIPTGMVMAGLVTGNCVLFKPSGAALITAAKLTELLIEAGVPTGVFQYLPAPGASVGNYLVEHPAIHTIAFTGSQAVGTQIYAMAARLQPGQAHLKRVIAEMGGKNAIIVDSSADLDQAIQGVVQSAFGYSGQKCSACSRVILLESIYEPFLQRLIAATQSLTIGPADSPRTTIGPVITAEAKQRLQGAIAQARDEGDQGDIVLEMSAPDNGHYVGPVIVAHREGSGTIAQTELFGPVLSVFSAKTLDEAIALANSTPFALTGGLYSRTPAHIERAQRDLEVGNLYINRGITGAIVARQPFGGFKLSGVGSKAGGPDYLLQFLEPRVITENIQRQGFAPIEAIDLRL